jgi:hypothetical protein
MAGKPSQTQAGDAAHEHCPGVNVPGHLWKAFGEGRMTADALLILILIKNLTRGRYGCIASNKWIAANSGGGGELRVTRILNWLEKEGYILRTKTLRGRIMHVTQKTIGYAGTPTEESPTDAKKSGLTTIENDSCGTIENDSCGTIENDSSGAIKNDSSYMYNKEEDNEENTDSVGASPTPSKKPKSEPKSEHPVLVPGLKKPKKLKTPPPTEVDLESARSLQAGLHRFSSVLPGYFPKKSSTSTWAGEFAGLREQDGVDQDLITEVLEWYCANMDALRVPSAWSGAGFRNKFAAIRQCMEINAEKKDTAPAIKQPQKALPLLKEEQAVLEQVQTLDWPQRAAEGLPAMIQECFVNGGRMYKALRKIQKQFPSRSVGTLAGRILGTLVPAKLASWIRARFAEMQKWEDWNGSLKPVLLSIENRTLQDAWAKESMALTNKRQAATDLIELVREHLRAGN